MARRHIAEINPHTEGPIRIWLDEHDVALDAAEALLAILQNYVNSVTQSEVTTPGPLGMAVRASVLDVVGAQTYTLGPGTYVGQEKIIMVRSVANTPNATLTVAWHSGIASGTQITGFDVVGDFAFLVWDGIGWLLIGNSGVTPR